MKDHSGAGTRTGFGGGVRKKQKPTGPKGAATAPKRCPRERDGTGDMDQERRDHCMASTPCLAQKSFRGEDAAEHRPDGDSIQFGYSLDRIPTDEMIHQRLTVNCGDSLKSLPNLRTILCAFERRSEHVRLRQFFRIGPIDGFQRHALVPPQAVPRFV